MRIKILSLLATLCLLFSFTAFANPSMKDPGIRIVTFPTASTNPRNTSQLDEQIKGVITKHGQDDLLKAYEQRDAVWAEAQMILGKIISGDVNIKNIDDYSAQSFKKINKATVEKVLKMVRAQKSDVKKMQLLDNNVKGDKGIIMIKRKAKGSTTVQMAVLFFLNKPSPKKKTGHLMMVFDSTSPFSKWLLSGLWVRF